MTKVISWARVSVTLYDPEADRFGFYVIATRLARRVLQRDAIIPRIGSGMGWAYEHKTVHIRPDLKRVQVFPED